MRLEGAGLDLGGFLRAHWQRRPLFIPGAFPDFVPELDADDIAGLACEELAESRRVTGSYPRHDWAVRHGPFEEADFADWPEQNWTLLVQDVEKHYPPLADLLAHFDFLPAWRIDDLMVSVAGPGGSVGPHVDQYDVFLLQAAGRRRWSIARQFDPALLPGCELEVLEHFEAEQEWVVEPGDVLYLPPGVAHHGVALDTGMTWSFGLRAPSAADLLQALGEWLAERPDEGGRFRDPPLDGHPRPGELDDSSIRTFRALLGSAGATGAFEDFLGVFLSRYRLAHDPAPPETPPSASALAEAVRSGGRLRAHPWGRMLWLPRGQGARLFASGEAFDCEPRSAQLLCDRSRLAGAGPELLQTAPELLWELVRRGHILIEPV